jgi:hypothetical protein
MTEPASIRYKNPGAMWAVPSQSTSAVVFFGCADFQFDGNNVDGGSSAEYYALVAVGLFLYCLTFNG